MSPPLPTSPPCHTHSHTPTHMYTHTYTCTHVRTHTRHTGQCHFPFCPLLPSTSLLLSLEAPPRPQ